MKPEKKEVALTDAEKAILGHIGKGDKMLIPELKSKVGLSGKQWDKGVKGLNKHGILKVEVEGEDKFFVRKD